MSLYSTLFTIVPVAIIFGWMHYKKGLSAFFKAEQDIQIEANPYATSITSPVSLPGMRVLAALGKIHGIDTSDLDTIIQETERKFGLGQRRSENFE